MMTEKVAETAELSAMQLFASERREQKVGERRLQSKP